MSNLTPRINRLEQNLVINGNFDVWQRGTSQVSVSSGQFLADRFKFVKQSSATFDARQSGDVPNTSFKSLYSLEVETNTVGVPSVGDIDTIQYIMEGYDLTRIFNKTAVLSFWAKSTLAGTYSVSLRNDAANQSMIIPYEVENANTWQKIELTIDMAAPGSWGFTSGRGLIIDFVLASDRTTGSTNTWVGGDFVGVTGQVNLFSGANTFNIAQVMINEGSAIGEFSRAGTTFPQEFALCQRYYYRLNGGDMVGTGMFLTSSIIYVTVPFPVESRTEAPLLESSSLTALDYERAGTSAASSNGGFSYLKNGENGATIGFNAGSVGTQGQATVVAASAGNYFAFNGEL